MSRWKQLVKQPKGALPGGIVTKAGIALIAVLIAGMLFSWSLTGPEADPMATATAPEPRAVDDRVGRALQGRLRAEAERQAQQAAANEARTDLEGRQDAAEDPATAETRDAASGAVGSGMGQAESELREALRLEEIERRTRSLRSLPVARSYRGPGGVRGGAGASPAAPEPPEAALDAALASFERSVAVLEGELAAGLAGQPFPALPGVAPPVAPRVPGTAEPGRNSPGGGPARGGSESARARFSKRCC